MELDTGSAVSIMPFVLFTQEFSHLKLKTAKASLRAYNGALPKTVGQVQVTVTLNKQMVSTHLWSTRKDQRYSVAISCGNFESSGAISTRCMPQLPSCQTSHSELTRWKIQKGRYADVFGQDVGCLRGTKGTLNFKPDASQS